MKNSFFLVLPALAFLACQAPNIPEKRFFHGYVRYLADEAELRAEASLLGVDSMPVTPPGGLFYETQPMTLKPLKPLHYLYRRNGAPGHLAAFSWTDEAQVKHEFVLPLHPVDSFTFGSRVIDRSRPDTLIWAGAALEKGETMVLMWQNLVTGQTVPMEIYGTAVLQRIEFPAAKMAEVPAGQWSLYLVRKKLVKSEAKGVTATGVAEYYSRADTVLVR